MIRLHFIPFILFLLCTANSFAQQTISGTFSSDGQIRSYKGAIPDNPQSPLRLVILFCGANEDAEQMELRGFNDFLGNNTIVIYPEPSDSTFGFDLSDNVDDYQMVEDLITDVASNYTIDEDDIFIGGFSNGAIFCYNLVCDFNSPGSTRAYSFKSFAIVSGAMIDGQANLMNCPVANEVPLIAFHGTRDVLILYNGGWVVPLNILVESVDTNINFWATQINNCNNTPTVTPLPDIVTERWGPSTVDHIEFDCVSRPNTQLYRINDGYHAWPGGNAHLDIEQARNEDINASELIAEFFESSTTVSTNPTSLNHSDLSVFPNPFQDQLNIQAQGEVKNLEIYSTSGKAVFTSTQPEASVSLKHLSPGVYILKAETGDGIVRRQIIKN